MEHSLVGMDRNFIRRTAFYDKDESGFLDTAGINSSERTPSCTSSGFGQRADWEGDRACSFNENDLTRKAVAKHTERLGPVVRGDLARDGKFSRHYFYRVAYGYNSDRKSDDREKSESQD